MNKINVLHIIFGGDVGGGARYLLHLTEGFDNNKYKLSFIFPRRTNFVRELEKRNFTTLVVNMESKFNIRTIFQIKNYIRTNQIQIVHTHGARASFYGRIAAKLAKAPIIITTVHASLYGYPVNRLKKIIYIYLDKLTTRFCDKIICVSNALADDLMRKTKINANKLTVIHNGIDFNKFNQIKDSSYLFKEFNITDENKTIGIIGRIAYEKGHAYFLKAIVEVIKVFPKLKCLIVGEGPLKREVEELSKELGILQNCIFTGVRYDIPEILSILNVLVLSSLAEGLPTVILEAMAARCPVVATRVGGIPELIKDNKTGLLVEPKDFLALAEAIINLLQDNKKAKEMAYTSRHVAEDNFTVEQMIKRTEGVYEEFIKKKLFP